MAETNELPVNKIVQGDALTVLKKFPSESVSCLMTSPPYWSLRDYGIDVETIWDAKEGCEHQWEDIIPYAKKDERTPEQKKSQGATVGNSINSENFAKGNSGSFCLKCNAWKGQLGLEPTFDLYIKHLCDIFDEAKRVLRKDGTCWVNLGDTYGGSGNSSGHTETTKNLGYVTSQMGASKGNQQATKGMEKSLCMVPFHFAFEMQNRGWVVRNILIWKKPNVLPSSAKDRFTVDYEFIFFFVKNRKYWFETQYEDAKVKGAERYNYGFSGNKLNVDRIMIGQPEGLKEFTGQRNKRTVWSVPYAVQPRTKEFIECRNLPNIDDFAIWLNTWRKEQGLTIDKIEVDMLSQAPHHWFNGEAFPSVEDWKQFKGLYNPPDDYDKQLLDVFTKSAEKQNYPQGRNMRTVWEITTQPFGKAVCMNCGYYAKPEGVNEKQGYFGGDEKMKRVCKNCGKSLTTSHFAIYPEALCETPLKAGCPEFICTKCGKPRVKTEKIVGHQVTEAMKIAGCDSEGEYYGTEQKDYASANANEPSETKKRILESMSQVKEFTYSDCGCGATFESGIVIDPFAGACTTALVALKLNRRFVAIELNPIYCKIGYSRIKYLLEQQKLGNFLGGERCLT